MKSTSMLLSMWLLLRANTEWESDMLIILTIISLISAIASGVYAYQSGSVAAEHICIYSVLGFAACLFVMAFGDGTEKEGD